MKDVGSNPSLSGGAESNKCLATCDTLQYTKRYPPNTSWWAALPSATVGEAKGPRMSRACGRTALIGDHFSQLCGFFAQKTSCEKNALGTAYRRLPNAVKSGLQWSKSCSGKWR